jgi:hypothetical protein
VSPSVTPAVVVATPIPVEPVREEPVVDLDDCRLYVAGYKGLKCLDADGREIATLLDVQMEDGLFIEDATIVAWSRATALIYFVDARSGESTDALSLIPPQSAACEPWENTGIEARLPRTGPADRLCLEIINGSYEEIADWRVAADIDLHGRSITFGGVWGHECMPDLPKVRQCPSPAPIVVTADEQHPYYVGKGALHRAREKGRAERVWGPFAKPPPREVGLSELDPIDVGFDTFEPVALTASGRYLILLGNVFKGDVGHMQALLLDRSSGELFPIPEKPSEVWPAPLDLDAIATIGDGNVETLWVTLDERPRMLPERDRFALADVLFEPRVGATKLPGRLIVAQ